MKSRFRALNLLPFLLLVPPMLSRYSALFGVEPCWLPGVLQTGYVRWFREPVFDAFLLVLIPRSIVGFAADALTLYLLLGSLNAKTVNFIEQTYFGGPVGIRRILTQCIRRSWSAARVHIVGEAKLVLLWPRTINLLRMHTPGRRAQHTRPGEAIYVSELVASMMQVAVVAILIMPLVSGLVFYVGILMCTRGHG